QPRKLYLHVDGTVSFAPPAKQGSKAYSSDPANPVPFLPRPISDEGWRTWMLQDQRYIADRRDVLTWRSQPLAEDLVVAGDVAARLVASTAGGDADWVVKLIDQYPETMPESPALAGFQLMVNADIMRGRFWRGFTSPTPIPSGPTTFTLDLHQQLYRFRRGHRIVVQVQSSWFPLYDRNPQSFVTNIFQAPGSAYRAMEHRVWLGGTNASHLVLPVLPEE
ncbi:MAG TPA: CocE/NonD family hydrolase, partial [Gemmatimonadales bacterium]|nr:CocE/NonD family hydrolase [Gemmatimonadales bacterium]